MAIMSNISRVDDGGGRQKYNNLVYDPVTGLWKPVTPTTTISPEIPTVPLPDSSSTDSLNTSGNTNSKEESEKKYIESEFNVLTGDLNLTPTEKSIRIKVNDTVKMEGLGKYLSGLYFVSSVSRTLSRDGGYSHSMSLIKNGFGDNVKSSGTTTISTPRRQEVTVSSSSSSFKVGDSVKIVGDDAVYSNASDGVKVPAWVKKKTLTIQQVSSDGTRVLLMPIRSWTYIKYIQKV